MASKLSGTRLPLPSSRPPLGRSAKRPREEETENMCENSESKSMRPPSKRPMVSRLKRSTSVSCLSNATKRPLTQKPTFNSSSTLRKTLHPNMASKISNTRSVSSRSIPTSKSAPNNPKSASNPDVHAKGKRAPWDLKGRLLDMEERLKQTTSQVSDYDSRISILELENNTLCKNLEQTSTTKQTIEGEVLKYEKELSETTAIKRRLELKVMELEEQTTVYESQIKALKSNLLQKTEALENLKVASEELTRKNEIFEKDLKAALSELEETKTIAESQHKKLIEGESIRRKLHNSLQELKGNIRVFCRVRPLLADEITKNESPEIHNINFIDEKSMDIFKKTETDSNFLKNKTNCQNFSFDKIFPPFTSQMDLFKEVSQLVQSALDGYNVCIFAYGQTGSGKTFTMEGDYSSECNKGMIPRTVENIFMSIKSLQAESWKYDVEASFFEIYNEQIRDLLVSPKEAKSTCYEIKMLDGKSSDVFVKNLKVVSVKDYAEVMDLLSIAQDHRAVAATNCNERSSRSHSVFKLKITGSNHETHEMCEGTLNLVDLAGSERLKESGAEGVRRTETQNINKSLSTLGNVIMALAQNQNHIPYRNSKLTHILQNSLGGNSKTLMLVNVSPSESCHNETLSSLRFATKVNQCHIGTASVSKKFIQK